MECSTPGLPAAAAKSLQLYPTLCDPVAGNPLGFSLGFSRQEYRSGLSCPSPMPESEEWKWNCSVVSDSPRPRGLQPTRMPFPSPSGLPGPHHLPEFVRCIGETIQLSRPLMPSSPVLNLSQHQGLFQWAVCSQQMTKILAPQPQHQSFQWIFGIEPSYRMKLLGKLT